LVGNIEQKPQVGEATTQVQSFVLIPSTQVATTSSGLAYSRVSQTFIGTVTLTNIGSTAIGGPLQLVLTALPADVTVVNATGLWNGIPYVTVPNITTVLPGQAVTVPVRFKNSGSSAIAFTPVVYSGTLP
jgi:hypothetical protein